MLGSDHVSSGRGRVEQADPRSSQVTRGRVEPSRPELRVLSSHPIWRSSRVGFSESSAVLTWTKVEPS